MPTFPVIMEGKVGRTCFLYHTAAPRIHKLQLDTGNSETNAVGEHLVILIPTAKPIRRNSQKS